MSNRLPSLDGLRAIAILMVLYAHLTGTPEFQGVDFKYVNYFISGDFGVHIFFVISGFLITSLLLNEESEHGKISLKEFYLRRILRIFPAYYFFIFTMIILNKYVVTDLDIRSVIIPLTYTTGLWSGAHEVGWTLGHSWTLSVEEQYYILYPFFLLFITQMRYRIFSIWILIMIVTLCHIVIYKYYAPTLVFSIFYRGDCILWGCLLAFYRKELQLFFMSRVLILNLLILLSLGVNVLLRHFSYNFTAGFLTVPFTNTCQSLFTVLLIVRFTILPLRAGFFYNLLNTKILVFIGVLSYSIYLWQQFVLQHDYSPYLWKKFPFNIIVIFVLAYCSYSLIEKPFLVLRKKILSKMNAGAIDDKDEKINVPL